MDQPIDTSGAAELRAIRIFRLAMLLTLGLASTAIAADRKSYSVLDNSKYDTNEQYGRPFAPAGITLQETGRMRMTSYAIRTWLETTADVANMKTLLVEMH